MLVLANNDHNNLKVTIICLIQRKKNMGKAVQLSSFRSLFEGYYRVSFFFFPDFFKKKNPLRIHVANLD